MEENNTPSNLEIKGDPSVTLTIRLIMQGKVSWFIVFFFFFFRFCFPYTLRLTVSIYIDFIPFWTAFPFKCGLKVVFYGNFSFSIFFFRKSFSPGFSLLSMEKLLLQYTYTHTHTFSQLKQFTEGDRHCKHCNKSMVIFDIEPVSRFGDPSYKIP